MITVNKMIPKNQVEYPCQLTTVPDIIEPIEYTERVTQFPNRARRFLKRRFGYLNNWIRDSKHQIKVMQVVEISAANNQLVAGDWVRVKSKADIQATLNRWNGLGGCGFMEEMWLYCGSTQRVRKRVAQFLDERDYVVKKCKHVVILENCFCNGTIDFGPCDRSCYFFWREEWLEKISSSIDSEVSR